MRRPQVTILPDGRRLHLQDGPIDLIIEVWAERQAASAAFAAAVRCMTGLLGALCDELDLLRRPVEVGTRRPDGTVAQRMMRAVRPYADETFITPMAAVAGAVADEVLAAMCDAAALDKAYVNNGGDIAVHLADEASLTIGLVDRPDQPNLFGTTVLHGTDRPRGIATSGRHGRSFSLGIADAVTVVADNAAAADAAATMIANAVDLPGHPAVTRAPAHDIRPDSDLGARLVTRAVGSLSPMEVRRALRAGQTAADASRARELCMAAALHLDGVMIVSGDLAVDAAKTRGVLAYA